MIERNEVVEAYGDRAMQKIVSDLAIDKFNERTKTGLCPVHSEKTGSFKFDPKTNIFHCFGCGHNIDIVSHTIDYNNYSYMQAIKELCDEIGIDSDITAAKNPQVTRKDEIEYKKPIEKLDKLTDKMIEHVSKRKILKSTLDFWRVGREDNKSFSVKGEWVNRTAFTFKCFDEYNELINIA